MHLVVSLCFGAGCLLLVLAVTGPRDARATAPVDDRLPARPAWSTREARTRVGVGALTGLLVAVTAQAVLGWPAMSAAAGAVGALVPWWVRRRQEERRRDAVGDAVAEAVDALRDATRVGIGIEDGLRALARTGPEALRPAFRALERDLRLVGFEEAIARARESVAHPAFDMLAVALLMSYRIGGRNLSGVLEGLGRAVRGIARARREVRAQQAEQVLSARVIAAMPLVVIVAIRGTSSGYLDVFSSPVGQAVLAACVAMVAAGYVWMTHTTTLPGRERVLR